MKSVLVEIAGGDAQDGVLQAALDLVRGTGAHLTCLQVTPDAAGVLARADDATRIMLAALLASIDTRSRAEQARLELVLAGEDIDWSWERRHGDRVEILANASWLVDVIVVGKGELAGPARQSGFCAALALSARAPVIVVPTAIKGFAVAGAAMIAWDGSPEAARALRAAVPLLKLAETVEILTVGEAAPDAPATAACTYLLRHGIQAEAVLRPRGSDTTARTILRGAAERGAAYLIMGAYGHARLHDFAVGSVTRSLLVEASMPIFLAH